MTLLDPPTGLRPVLEDDHLLAATLADHLGTDLGIRDQRTTDRGLIAICDEQHPLELDRAAGLGIEALDLELGPDLDPILLSARFDDRVHGTSGTTRLKAALDRDTYPGTPGAELGV